MKLLKIAVVAAVLVATAAAPAAATEEPCANRTVAVAGDARMEGGQIAGGRLSFAVTTTGCVAGSVSYRTVPVTSTENVDYTPAAGTLSWNRSDTTIKTVSVSLAGDIAVETDETLRVELFSPTAGVTVSPASGIGTIINDDEFMAIPDSEPDCMMILLRCEIVFRLTAKVAYDVTVTFSTSNGTATEGEDFVGVPTGTVVIPAGATTATASVAFRRDRLMVVPEYFYINTGLSRVRATIPVP